MRVALLSTLLVVAAAGAAQAQPVSVSIGGGYLAQNDTFTHAIGFAEYLEPAHVGGKYPGQGGALIDIAVNVPVHRGWSVQGSGGFFRRTSDVALRGEIPHPLYYGQLRDVEATLPDLARRETTLRGEVAWSLTMRRRVHLTFSGGPIAVHASQELADAFRIREVGYPYDAVEIDSTVRRERGWGFGATGAINAAWLASRRVAVGVTGRFSRATVTLREEDAGPDLTSEASGPSVTATLRLTFP